MMTLASTLLTIALLHWAVLLLPGFNFVLIGQLAASGQRRAAWHAVGGMTTATLAWALLAVAGVGVVFAAHPLLRQGVQIAGGLYLLQLAWRLWRSGSSGSSGAAAQAPQPGNAETMGPAAAFRVGFMTSALNPKIALFYGSVFATALPANPSPQLVGLAVAMVYANSVVWHSFLAAALSHPQIQRAYLQQYGLLNRLSAGLVGVFGAKLIVAAAQELRGRSA